MSSPPKTIGERSNRDMRREGESRSASFRVESGQRNQTLFASSHSFRASALCLLKARSMAAPSCLPPENPSRQQHQQHGAKTGRQ
jgi:hypothetical protein